MLALLFGAVVVSASSHQTANACVSKNPAWNGQQSLPHQHSPPCGSVFSPYFVPEGSISLDDDHNSILYRPQNAWNVSKCSLFVGGSMHVSNVPGANVTVKFRGTGIQWFGKTSHRHGSPHVLIDNASVGVANLWSGKTFLKQRLFGVSHLADGEHTLTIKNDGSRGHLEIDVDAFVVTTRTPGSARASTFRKNAHTRGVRPAWTLEQKGQTGVAAMQLAVISDTEAIIIDKVEHNPLSVKGHPAWGAIYNLEHHTVRPLDMKSNSFCAGGSFLGNGTLINVGGNPIVEDATGVIDFGDENGLQGIRLFNPCPGGLCDIYDRPKELHMMSSRWYPTVSRLDDGSVGIIGGSTRGGWMNNVSTNNPTIEFFPPKPIGDNGVIHLNFLINTLNSNLFPIAFTIPDGRIFVAANQDAMIYNWRTNHEQMLPPLPNRVRVTYPMTGTALLLPLTFRNNFEPEMLICGGSALDDQAPPSELSAQDPASNQCSRMVLTETGIAAGWQVEEMPDPRIMPDAVLLPNGRVIMINGGRKGIAGYGNVKLQVGSSNADDPVFTPVLYDPRAPVGHRFTSEGMPSSNIPRLYHSVATLVPDGSIMIAGSNPNLDLSTVAFGTEYRVEWLRPDYMSLPRPRIVNLPERIDFRSSFTLDITVPGQTDDITVSLMDLGFVTHSVHMNSRLVELESKLASDGRTLTVSSPPSGTVYPPGPAWIYVLADGVPSVGRKLMVGNGIQV
ncbi:copper radical oxidase [Rhizoctonia solani AG-3 Rhs1AP]|uniref:Copper radical oxidase n=1 Tax=Rhizoctonia solani AG-3 Rhs1AP TaxID=1086054 RepID=X8J2D5_9AGAM|nr:copper radical oxidase [Rhizoctonia solani AG-3 Rhs1AP]